MDENPAGKPAETNPASTDVGAVEVLRGDRPWPTDASPGAGATEHIERTAADETPATPGPAPAAPVVPVPLVAPGAQPPPVDPATFGPPPTYDTTAYDTAAFATGTYSPFAAPGSDGAGGGGHDGFGGGEGAGGSGNGRAWARRAGAIGVVAVVALASGATGAVIANHESNGPTGITTASPVSVGTGTDPTETLAKVAAAVEPSVVSITVQSGSSGDEGSGVILRSDGTILTNNHVIESAADGAGTISVKFASGKTASATIVGRDPGTDLAVIKTTGVSGLTPATLASGSTLHVGDTVLAIGSPLGLDGSVTSGIISALHRQVGLGTGSASLTNAIQTDAAVNPGNSGGALVDIQGRVVGINSAIATLGSSSDGSQSGSIGLGFAIPIAEANSVANTLIAGGTVAHAVLGVQITDGPNGGALIDTVSPGSGAADAGLQPNDVITAVGGEQVADGDALSAAVRAHQPGDKVVVTFTRGGQTRTATVTLGSSTS